jgi:hypothetical protein
MLVEAADRPRVAVRWTRDATLVRRRLETLEALDVAGDLAPAVALAVGEARARPGTRVAVFTDLPPAATGLPADDLAAVDYVQLGRTDDNVAVSRLTVDAPPFATPAGTTATVVVRNHGGAPRRVVLDARVGDRPWARRELSLPAHDATTVQLSDPPGTGVVTVMLDAHDALAADDTAFGWIGAGTAADLLVVSETPGARESVGGARARDARRARRRRRAGRVHGGGRSARGVRRRRAADPPPARALVVSPPMAWTRLPGGRRRRRRRGRRLGRRASDPGRAERARSARPCRAPACSRLRRMPTSSRSPPRAIARSRSSSHASVTARASRVSRAGSRCRSRRPISCRSCW